MMQVTLLQIMTSSGDGFGRFLSSSNGSQVHTSLSLEAASPSHQQKVNNVSKYAVTAAKNPEFAQKLHAVLLESGASPPPDLFQDINTALVVEGDPLGDKHSAERMAGKQNVASDSSAKYNHQGLYLPSYGEQLYGHSLLHNVDSGKMEFVNSPVEPDGRCSHTNHTEIVEETETEGAADWQNCETGNKDKFRLVTNSDSSGTTNKGRLNHVLNDVADWEISRGDVQIGDWFIWGGLPCRLAWPCQYRGKQTSY